MLTLSGNYSKKHHTFLELTSSTTDIFRELLVKNTTQCSRVYIKQYWHFQKVPSKLNYSKNFFPEFTSQNTNTLKKLLSHNINLFRARISNSNHTWTEYYQTIVNTFECQWTFEQTEYTQTENFLVKVKNEKVSIRTWNR